MRLRDVAFPVLLICASAAVGYLLAARVSDYSSGWPRGWFAALGSTMTIASAYSLVRLTRSATSRASCMMIALGPGLSLGTAGIAIFIYSLGSRSLWWVFVAISLICGQAAFVSAVVSWRSARRDRSR